MEQFRIVERDGDYKVQKMMEPTFLGIDYVKKQVGKTWIGRPIYETKENRIYGDASWIDWFAMDGLGNVLDCPPTKYDPYICQRMDKLAFFEDKEAAISYIEYYYGQKYTLEEAEWRIV